MVDFFILLEAAGDQILLEDGSGSLLLEEPTEGGGAGPAGRSRSVGAHSLADQRRRQQAQPPKPKRRLEFKAPLHITSQIATPLELAVRVSSELKADSQSILLVKSSMKSTPSTTLNLEVTPFAVISNRFEVQGNIEQSLTASVEVTGQRYLDIDDVDKLPSELAMELMKKKAFRDFYG